ncbi:MAG: regulator of Vps4 activity in the MVB pathway-domain-containing protein, partial [Olpidium bornovanus]
EEGGERENQGLKKKWSLFDTSGRRLRLALRPPRPAPPLPPLPGVSGRTCHQGGPELRSHGNPRAILRASARTLWIAGADEVRPEYSLFSAASLRSPPTGSRAKTWLVDDGSRPLRQCDQAISEAVNTIIYAAPRSEVKELQLVSGKKKYSACFRERRQPKNDSQFSERSPIPTSGLVDPFRVQVRDQLILKFGRDFAVAAMENRHNLVNPRVINKLKVETPELSLVEKYLETIAAEYKVDWKPANCDDVDECEISEDDYALLDLPEDGKKTSRLSAGQDTPAPVGFCTSCGSHEVAVVGKVGEKGEVAAARGGLACGV